MKTFKCTVCDEFVESAHMHHITAAIIEELSAVTGKKLRKNGLCCCRHFEAHSSPRFTKKNPAKVKLDYATPRLISPSKRHLGATQRDRAPVALAKPSPANELKAALQRISALEKENAALTIRLEEASVPMLRRLVPNYERDVNLESDSVDLLRYWCGVSKLSCIHQFLALEREEKRGRKSILSDLDRIVLTLFWLRRGMPLQALALFAGLERSTVSRLLDGTVEKMYEYV